MKTLLKILKSPITLIVVIIGCIIGLVVSGFKAADKD